MKIQSGTNLSLEIELLAQAKDTERNIGAFDPKTTNGAQATIEYIESEGGTKPQSSDYVAYAVDGIFKLSNDFRQKP